MKVLLNYTNFMLILSEYTSDNTLVPKNTSVIVVRVPLQRPHHFSQQGKQPSGGISAGPVAAAPIAPDAPFVPAPLVLAPTDASANASAGQDDDLEDERIRALMQQPASLPCVLHRVNEECFDIFVLAIVISTNLLFELFNQEVSLAQCSLLFLLQIMVLLRTYQCSLRISVS